ncbi:Secreted RxLR effector peptide protein [Phytophthora palmivora]|uniref:Secreted RxLR effector peptide protein n=1 Tax=Phytophthora palmivora TaxID=4796 RepID=A0A2P4Y6Z3_9STRA|nr:Secreted RxLR effector peptide protein [Phytophthora palmivora]
MHWQCFVALVAIATFATVDAAVKPAKSRKSDKFYSSQRVLRIHNAVDSGDFGVITETNKIEERGAGAPAVEALAHSLRLSDDFDDWLKKGESADNVFKLLALDQAADNLLANSKLNTWIDYMKIFNKENPTKRTSVIETLTTHYGDEGLAKIIEAAKLVPATAGLAKRVQTEQIQRWLVAGETPEGVYKLLKLDEAGQSLFEQPQIVTWAKYLDNFNKEHPESRMPLLSFLQARYKDEATLVQMLIAAEKVYSTKSLAVRVQAEQTNQWLRMEKVPADVFKLLKLDNIGFSLLENTLFSAWVKYTDDFRKIYYGTKLTTISVLKQYYSDHVLAVMVLTAIQSPSSSGIAKRLYSELLRNWKIQNVDPVGVFKLLKLDQTKGTLFDSPLFNLWTSFVGYYSSFRPKNDVMLLTELAKIYNERDLTAILVKAYDVPRTKEFASNLLKGQLNRWLAAKKDPEGVFYLLNAEGATVNDVRKRIYDNYVDVFAKLPKTRKRKRIPDKNAPNKKAKTAPVTNKPNKKVKTASVRNKPNKRVKSGAVPEAQISTLHSTITDFWSYVPTNRHSRIRKFENFSKNDVSNNEDNSEERGVSTSPIETLTSSLKLTDDFDDWIKKGESADDAFKLLALDNAADDLLSNPKLKSWISYMKLFNEQNPTEKTSVIATLTAHYGDDVLAKIIEAGKKVPSTEALAKRLQSEQMQHWLGKGKTPDDVFALLKLDKAGSKSIHILESF